MYIIHRLVRTCIGISDNACVWLYYFLQHSVFRDLTLTQPLNNLARLCWYADRQLYDHIGESSILVCVTGGWMRFLANFRMLQLRFSVGLSDSQYNLKAESTSYDYGSTCMYD